MAAREGLEFETSIESDLAPLVEPVLGLLESGIEVHCLRDLTRGGLASALVEIAETARLAIVIEEQAIGVREDVRGACEILGYDPLYVANEGRFVAFIPADETDRALAVLRTYRACTEAMRIGFVQDGPASHVVLRSRIGVQRILEMLSGEQLPRIC